MNEQELQDLALKLAREAIVKTHDSSFYVAPTVIEMVRAAVAHGLRMGAEVCEQERLDGESDDREDMAYNVAILHCKSAILASAKKIEGAQ